MAYGFVDREGFLGMIKAWRALYDLINPDVLLLNHSPTALVASRGLGIPRATIGTGFECPPSISPMPVLSPMDRVPKARLVESEGWVLTNVNKALGVLGLTSCERFCDLFEVDRTILCTLAELDPYSGHRQTPHYWGPRLFAASTRAPNWPSRGEKRIFGYLKLQYAGFNVVLKQLRETTHAVLLHVPGLTQTEARRYQSPSLAFSSVPLDLEAVAKQCNLAICHAGHGTVATMLLGGVPQLLLPMQVEQGLTAWRLTKEGGAISVFPGKKKPDYSQPIRALLMQDQFANQAKNLALVHAGFNAGEQSQQLATQLETLIRG